LINPSLSSTHQWDYLTIHKSDEPVAESKSTGSNIMDKIAQVESSNQHTDAQGNLTESPVGALGKYQIMPETAKDPGFGIKPIKDLTKAPESEHKRFASEYYQAMLNEFNGDQEKALAAYNGGPTMVKEAVNKYGADWKAGIPAESKDYIMKVASL
jgi:soluble lytic murein transglycosylase-like protein